MKTIRLNIFIVLSVAASVYSTEIDTNKFYLILSNYDEGAINDPTIEAGIVSFTKTSAGKYMFNKVEQTMELGETATIDFKFNREIIVAKKDNPSTLQIINIKRPNKVLEYKLQTYTKTSVTYSCKDEIVLYEIYPNNGGSNGNMSRPEFVPRVSLFNTTNGHISKTNTSFWSETVGLESFFLSDSIRYRRIGMNNAVYLSSPPESFLNQGNNSRYVHREFKSDINDQKMLNRASIGDKIIYFFAIDLEEGLQKKDCLWLYDRQEKSWSFDCLPCNSSEFRAFGNNLAVRHASRRSLAHTRTYSGFWSLYLSGKKLDVYLGWDSNVLYLSNTMLIFNDSNRLYEYNISENSLTTSNPHLIADHNYIRYAKFLFFQNKEQK